MDLGKLDLFLGHNWLQIHNPTVNWSKGKLELDKCDKTCRTKIPSPEGEIFIDNVKLDPGDWLFALDTQGWLAMRSIAQEIIEETNKVETFEERVPEAYHQFKDVFDKDSFDELPERRPWDHAIELIPGSKPVDCKVYPLSRKEQEELDKFLEENLSSGRIRDSKSPMASPFFFIEKKPAPGEDPTKRRLRPVQDYRKLNDMTIKNR